MQRDLERDITKYYKVIRQILQIRNQFNAVDVVAAVVTTAIFTNFFTFFTFTVQFGKFGSTTSVGNGKVAIVGNVVTVIRVGVVRWFLLQQQSDLPLLQRLLQNKNFYHKDTKNTKIKGRTIRDYCRTKGLRSQVRVWFESGEGFLTQRHEDTEATKGDGVGVSPQAKAVQLDRRQVH